MSSTVPAQVGAPASLRGARVALGGQQGGEELPEEENRAKEPQEGSDPFPSPPEWGLLGVSCGASPVLGCEGAWGMLGVTGCTGVIWGVRAEVCFPT